MSGSRALPAERPEIAEVKTPRSKRFPFLSLLSGSLAPGERGLQGAAEEAWGPIRSPGEGILGWGPLLQPRRLVSQG